MNRENKTGISDSNLNQTSIKSKGVNQKSKLFFERINLGKYEQNENHNEKEMKDAHNDYTLHNTRR